MTSGLLGKTRLHNNKTISGMSGKELEDVAVAMVIASDKGALVPPALVAVRLTVKVPLLVGVPEIRPLLALSVTPAGSVPVTA